MVSPSTDLQMALVNFQSPASKPSLLLFTFYLIGQSLKVQGLNSWQLKIFIPTIKHMPSGNLVT